MSSAKPSGIPPPASDIAPLAAVGLISAAALGYEILLIRIFAIVHWHHLVAIAISLALLGYGASGTFLVLAGRRLRNATAAAFVTNALLFSMSSVACVHLAQRLPFDPQALTWDSGQLILLAGTFLVLAVPFFAAANCVGLTLWAFKSQIPRVYGFDLVGAGLGALSLLVGLNLAGADKLLLAIMGLGAAAAALGAQTMRWRSRLVAGVALTTPILITLWIPPTISPAPYKDLSRALTVYGAALESETSGIAGVVSVVGNERVPARTAPGMSLQATAMPPRQKAVFLDGDGVGTLAEFDPAGGSSAYLHELLSALPYTLAEKPARVAVLNAGTGLGVRQAITLGASRVVAVEPNPQLHALSCGRYRVLQPDACSTERVAWHVQAPRAFLAGSPTPFDLITLSLAADPTGVDALAIDYSATVEAVENYLRHITGTGLLAIDGPTRAPPRLSLRLLSTAKTALARAGIADPAEHIAMLRGWQRFILLISRSPVDAVDRRSIRQFSTAYGFDLVWLPQMGAVEANRYQQLARPLFHLGAAEILADTAPDTSPERRYRRQPVTDDAPYPNLSTRWADLRETLLSGDAGQRAQLDTGLLIAAVTLIVVGVSAFGLILLPLIVLRQGGDSTGGATMRMRTLSYFALIGGAFLAMEIAWIQRLQLFLGHPVYATTAVLAAFLVFAGAGSLWSQRQAVRYAHRRLLIAVALIALAGVAYLFLAAPGLAAIAGNPLWVRIGAVVLLLAPLAFAMGIPFPTALRVVGARAPGLVPWAWGINGCASVIAAAATPLLGSEIGFSGLSLAAVCSYLALPLIGLTRQA